MKILILGGDGMLGHQLVKSLMVRHDIRATLRQQKDIYSDYGLFNFNNSYFEVDVTSFTNIVSVMADFKPEVVINCVGIIKQRPTAKEYIPSLEINSLFPHRLSVLCKATGARLIHFSTDCVFSGNKGNYQEKDHADSVDLYGRTKYLGELHEDHCLTLRSSIIGSELSRKSSLFEWFMAQKGTINGFTKALYNGFTTIEMSRIVEMMITHYPKASGVYQVSSDHISKYDLLELIGKLANKNIEIIPNSTFDCNRTLDSTRFRSEFDYAPPCWEDMINELVKSLEV